MGFCSSKAATVDAVHSTGSNGKKEPLPAMLAAASVGRFHSALPPSAEGRRDFARIFFASERKIFVFASGMMSMKPIQPSTGPSSAHIGDMSEQVVERAVALFHDSLKAQLAQAFGGQGLEEGLLETLTTRAIDSMTVNIAIDFAVKMNLMPTFLQPAFLIVLLGEPLQARAATYGFVAQKPMQIQGDRPESKRTPFCVRLLSPNLLASDLGQDSSNNWEVEYSAMGVQTSTITQAVEMDMAKIREAVKTSTWDPLRC